MYILGERPGDTRERPIEIKGIKAKNKIMKKILIAVMACALCLGLMGGAFAYFNDTETSTGNTFSAGTMDISLGTATYSSGIGNMAPGDTVTVTVDVTSDGTLSLDYVVSTAVTGGIMLGENAGADDPYVSEVRIDTVVTSSDSLSESGGGDAGDTIEVDITRPTTAGNNSQGLSGALAITVDATSN